MQNGTAEENTKFVFIVYNNLSKKFIRYNLSDDRVLYSLFSRTSRELLKKLLTCKQTNGYILLSDLIQLVLKYENKLDSLYVYDTSCSSYDIKKDLGKDAMDDLNKKINSLAEIIGK